MRVELILPWPPSVNRVWRMGKGRMYVNPKTLEWRERATEAVSGRSVAFGWSGDVSATMRFYAPSRRRYDIDNRAKSVGDWLQQAGVIEDDSQIRRLVLERGHVDKGRGAVWLILEAMDTDVCPGLPQ